MLGLSWLKDVVVYTTTTGFSWGLFLGLFLVGILFYVLVAWLLYRIGKKLGYQKSWYAWVPFLNYWMMVELSTRESSWFWIIFITMFIPCINIVGLVMLVIVMMDISEACGKESWWGILWIIPIVNFVIMYILGSGPAVPPQPPAAGYGPPPQGPPPPTYAPPPPPQQ
jgi:hypothetical protein